VASVRLLLICHVWQIATNECSKRESVAGFSQKVYPMVMDKNVAIEKTQILASSRFCTDDLATDQSELLATGRNNPNPLLSGNTRHAPVIAAIVDDHYLILKPSLGLEN
jgi:hypothetical protein